MKREHKHDSTLCHCAATHGSYLAYSTDIYIYICFATLLEVLAAPATPAICSRATTPKVLLTNDTATFHTPAFLSIVSHVSSYMYLA